MHRRKAPELVCRGVISSSPSTYGNCESRLPQPIMTGDSHSVALSCAMALCPSHSGSERVLPPRANSNPHYRRLGVLRLS